MLFSINLNNVNKIFICGSCVNYCKSNNITKYYYKPINYNTNYSLISKAPGGKGSGNYGFDFSFKIENVKYKEKF